MDVLNEFEVPEEVNYIWIPSANGFLSNSPPPKKKQPKIVIFPQIAPKTEGKFLTFLPSIVVYIWFQKPKNVFPPQIAPII